MMNGVSRKQQWAIPLRALGNCFRGKPLVVSFEVTLSCPARCRHCDTGGIKPGEQRLFPREFRRYVEELGPVAVQLSGGEPLLRPDWRTLVAHAAGRGLGVSVYTNGSPVTRQVADDLVGLGVVSVAVSLDSHSPAVHDHLHRQPGLFRLATEAIRLLAERGMRVVVELTPTRANVRDACGVAELARDLGARAVNLGEYAVAGRAPRWLGLDPTGRERLAARWRDLAAVLKDEIELTRSDEHGHPEALGGLPACHASRHGLVAGLLPDGILTPCLAFPSPVGSLLEAPPAVPTAAAA